MATAKRKSKVDDWSYEGTVTQIEEILNLIERGEMDLADMFDQFRVAIEYLKQCEQFLGDQQSQVDLLIETLNNEES